MDIYGNIVLAFFCGFFLVRVILYIEYLVIDVSYGLDLGGYIFGLIYYVFFKY